MATNVTASFNAEDGTKFVFCLVINCGEMSGIVIAPEMDITHISFQKALQWVKGIYPYVRALYTVIEYGEDFITGEHGADDQYELASLIEEGIARGIFTVDDATLQMARDIRDGIIKKRKPVARRKTHTKTDGYVYLLKAQTGQYKIGRTKNPANRLKTFGVKLPFEVEYQAVIPAADMYDLEVQLHARFANKRIDGEWFSLTPDDVEYIKSLAVQS